MTTDPLKINAYTNQKHLRPNMNPQSVLFMPLFLATFLFALQPILTVGSADSSTGDADFIRTSCTSTLYPHFCYTSLSAYAGSVQNDPARLVCIAIGVCLSKTFSVAAYVVNITRRADDGSDDPRAAAVVHDCFSNLGDAVEKMHSSLKQMRQLVSSGSAESFGFQMSNVQTWMSAALTDEETCTEGFEDVNDETVKAEVCNRVAEAKKLTSNALALVNSYAEKGIP